MQDAKMVVQNFKSKNDFDTNVFLSFTDRNICDKKKLRRDILYKFSIGIILLFLLLTNIMLFYFLISKITTITRLQDQINALQQDVYTLKYYLLDDNIQDDISQFQFESYTDTNNNQLDDSDLDNEDGDRKKREILATLDGVPIIPESYAEQKRRTTNYSTSTSEGLRLYESLGKNTRPPTKQHTSGWTTRTYMNHKRKYDVRPTAIVSRTSRVMYTDEDRSKAFRKVVKKSLVKPENLQEHVESVTMTSSTARRGHRHGGGKKRNGHLETAEVVAAHYFGNTSHMEANKHHGYRGNGHLAHPQGRYVDWHVSSWVSSLDAERMLHLEEGNVSVRESGLYFVYAQIYYVDQHDVNGFRIVRNEDELAQCTTMTHTERKLDKRNSCWTGTLAALSNGDRISVRDIETHRYAYMEHGKSFFGLIKLADLNNFPKHQQHHAHTIK